MSKRPTHVENGRRVLIEHPSALSGAMAGLVTYGGKTTLGYQHSGKPLPDMGEVIAAGDEKFRVATVKLDRRAKFVTLNVELVT